METPNYLTRRRNAELNQALATTCPEKRGRHEELARAYGKIIAVLDRESTREQAARLS